MHKYEAQISVLNEQLEGWAEAFKDFGESGQQVLGLTSPIGEGEGLGLVPEFIPTKYAISFVLDIRGRLLELIDAYEAKWPQQASWCEEQRAQWPLDRVLGRAVTLLENKENSERLALDDWPEVIARTIDPEEEQQEEHFEGIIFSHRDVQARLFALENDFPNFRPELELESKIVTESFAKLGDKRSSVARGLRSFVRNEGIVPWVRGKDEKTFGERYAPLFECISEEGDHLASARWFEDVQGVLGDMSPEVRSEVERVLHRIFDALEHFGFEQLAEELTANGGQLGPLSSVGSGRVNVIPGDGGQACHEIVLAVGRTGLRYVYTDLGIRRVMRLLRRHLLDCGPRTQAVIIMTDRRQQGWEEESRYDLRWHQGQGKKVLVLETDPRFRPGPRLREF
ncbi:hypothetical protein [Erythrobacter aurantius]|uniref:hypothetical protein n=1 Tax=Erythrobacter aurantius TaxID=2909249 RepID=UPI002079AD63|nr:hypothetical protein [Erythrobacter aurantius]